MVHSSSVVCEFYSVNVGFSLPNFLLDAQCLPVKSDHLLRVPHPARGGAIRMKVGHRGKMRVSIARYNPLRAARPKNLRFPFLLVISYCNKYIYWNERSKKYIKPRIYISVALTVDASDLKLNVVVQVIIEATDKDFKRWKHPPKKWGIVGTGLELCYWVNVPI